MINWKVRLKNKTFWLGIIPLALILVKEVLAVFGVEISVDVLSEELLGVVGTVFAILGMLGVVNDPTTAGLSDSELAMTYETPKVDSQETEEEIEEEEA